MREEVRSSSAAPPDPPPRSASPPATPVASSAGASSPPAQTNAASIDWLGGEPISKVESSSQIAPHAPRPSLSTNAAGAAVDFSQPSCRPWERGDLLRRLATFKSSTWASKPKAASSLACARRGWVNIEMDKIACESCGAHLIFTALTSWSPAEVANAGEAFAEQLDASHLGDCPWRGNSCADSLVQFHLTPSALVGGFKDRCDGLLQFISLPVIAKSAIESMKLTRSPQIDCVLSQAITILSGELGYKTDSTTGIDINHQDESCSYSQAQKLISLCGWEPRWLPNVQDWEENSTRSAKHTASADPDQIHSRLPEHKQNSYSASVKKDKGKGKIRVKDSGCSMRSPLLDCSLCGATVRIWDFRSVPRPSHLSINNIGAPDMRKGVLTRGISATSGINGWVAEGTERENVEGRGEAGTDEGKSLSNAQVDLNLTMAGGLPSTHSVMPSMHDHFNDGGMGRDLMIGQPTGSELGGFAASFESRGPSSRKRNLEEGGSTADKPLNRLHPADSIEGTVIDRDGDEVDDGAQDSDIRSNKRPRGFNLFDVNRPSSSGAGPSRNLSFDLDIDVNKFDTYKAEGPSALHNPSASMRASSVIAMDTVHSAEENSTESVEYHPCDVDDVHKPSSAVRSGGMSEALDLNYSNQAPQSSFVQPAAESNAREIGGSSMNGGEEVLNAETAPAFARDQLSLGVSGGSVGMGASHEAEIHGVDVSEHKTDSVVGDVEPAPELTENMGNTGESAPGPGMMDEFVPEDVGREEPQGDSQDVASRLVGRADSGSKICGSTKADSVESGEKMSHAIGHESNLQHSLSRNARVYSGIDLSKDEVTQIAKLPANDDYDPGDDLAANGGNDYEAGLPEFDPISHHNNYCPWVNGHVAAACCINTGSSTSTGLSGWQLTVDALETIQSLAQAQNQLCRLTLRHHCIRFWPLTVQKSFEAIHDQVIMALRCMLMRARTTALRPPPSSGQTSSPASILAGALRSPAAVLMTPHTSPAAAAASSRRHLSTLFRQIGEGYNPVAKRGLYVRDVLQRFGLTHKRNCSSSAYSAQYSKIRHDPSLELGLRRKGEIWEHIKTASIILGSCSAIAAAYFVVGSFMMQELDAKMKHRFDHAKTHIDAKMDEQGFREAIGMLFLLFILMLFLFALVDADDCKGKSIRKRKKKPSLLHN
ncbi:hypothetical protein OsI_24913 [Oryza sativa Indica Group]|uniref:Uncharacterized protein n=1 Tax=Oryza sativa subsp. indica TaxID=39946 RepID=A2YI76_ORYSI|nr:hypothetical protein OsI_24913 [Oryza sativa Indica Group]